MAKKRTKSDPRANLMDLKRFWDLLNFSLNVGPDATDRHRVLRDELRKLPPKAIMGFALRYNDLERVAYHWNVWGAAYLIQGGCSDDGFIDFRCWLVAQGQPTFDNALSNPDSLADVVDGQEVGEEGLDGAAWAAWLAATGSTEEDYYQEYHRLIPPWVEPDMGEHWDHDSDEEVRRRLPRLAKLYLDQDE